MTFTAEQAGHMPVEIWGYMESVLILNTLLTAMAHLLATIHLWLFKEKALSVQA